MLDSIKGLCQKNQINPSRIKQMLVQIATGFQSFNYPPPRLRAGREWLFLRPVGCGLWAVVWGGLWELVVRGSQDPYGTVARPLLGRTQGLPKRIFFHHFFDSFFNRFLIALGSIFPPNLVPKTHQNQSKIDAKRQSILGFNFWLIFDGFLVLTSTLGPSRIKPPLQREHDFSKNRFSQFVSIFLWFWCQHACIFLPKIH